MSEPLLVDCPHCGTLVSVLRSVASQTVECGSCGRFFLPQQKPAGDIVDVEDFGYQALTADDPPAAPRPAPRRRPGTIVATCPQCGHEGELPPAALGKQIRCRACGHAFFAGGGQGFDVVEPKPAPSAPREQWVEIGSGRGRAVPPAAPRRSLFGCLGIVATAVLAGCILSALIGRVGPANRQASRLDDAEDTVARYGAADSDFELGIFDRPVRVMIYRRPGVQFSFRMTQRGWECFLMQDSVSKRDLTEAEARGRFR